MIHGRNIAFLYTLLLGIFFCTSTASAAALQKPPNNLGLVGYWPMNEGTSTKAGDFSGRGNTGTLTNMATPPTATSGWGNGKLGGGLNFDGSNDYVDVSGVAGASSPIASGDVTVSAWFKRSTSYSASSPNYEPFFAFGDPSSTNDLWLMFNNHPANGTDGGLCFMVYDSGFYNSCTTQASWNAGEWHHVIATYSGSVGSKIYIDGVQVGSNGHLGRGTVKTAFAAIGKSHANQMFPGTIDEFRIYNRALSATEVTNLYQSGSARLNTSQNNKVTNGLVGLWSFDGADMSGNTAYDRSTSGNNGTLTNGPARAIGKVGQGLSFDGVDDVVIPLNPDPGVFHDANSIRTISGWMTMNNTSGPNVFYEEGSSTNGLVIGYRSTPKTIVFASAASSVLKEIASVSTFNADPNRWVFVTAIFNNGTLSLYINGVLESAGTAAYSSIPYHTDPPGIGDSNNSDPIYGLPWKGSIDDVRIYNRALTQAEITQLYNMGGSKLNAPQNNIPGSTLQSGLVGFWSFNGPDMSGNTAYDRSTSGNNGTLANGPVRVIGKVGQGLSFDGSTSFVDLSAPASLNLSGVNLFTLSAWVYPTATPNGAGVIAEMYTPTSSTVQYTIGFSNSVATTPNHYPTVGFFSGGWYTAIESRNIDLNTWSHIVGTWDGTTLKLYRNGVLVAQSTPGGSLPSANFDKVVIGKRHDTGGTTSFFPGKIDEARIYNRVLTQAEVTQLYLLGK